MHACMPTKLDGEMSRGRGVFVWCVCVWGGGPIKPSIVDHYEKNRVYLCSKRTCACLHGMVAHANA